MQNELTIIQNLIYFLTGAGWNCGASPDIAAKRIIESDTTSAKLQFRNINTGDYGSVWFVLGNGDDVIHDWTRSIDEDVTRFLDL